VSTWAILAAGVGLGIGLTLAIAWLFTLSRRVARLEAHLAGIMAAPRNSAMSLSREITVGGPGQ